MHEKRAQHSRLVSLAEKDVIDENRSTGWVGARIRGFEKYARLN